jgi:hypothetical protein
MEGHSEFFRNWRLDDDVLRYVLERLLDVREMCAHSDERLMRLLELLDVVLKPNGHHVMHSRKLHVFVP